MPFFVLDGKKGFAVLFARDLLHQPKYIAEHCMGHSVDARISKYDSILPNKQFGVHATIGRERTNVTFRAP